MEIALVNIYLPSQKILFSLIDKRITPKKIFLMHNI